MINIEKSSIINKERLNKRLLELGEIGKQESGGVTRLALSREDEEAIELVTTYMKEAGLTVRKDAVGNLIGRREGRTPNAPVVITGSHIDTVYEGGIFDGSLGILAGIEVLQTMNEQGIITEHPIEVCAYRDEEGVRFAVGLSGARGTVGKIKPDTLQHTDKDGISIAEALKSIGIDPLRIGEAERPKGSAKAHVELHIEQGKVLETKNLSVGIVTGICCSSRLKVRIVGEAGHAGTTPMNIRRDPLVATAEIIQLIEKETLKTGTTVGTVGRVTTHPGGVNVIPGMVEFTIDIRDLDGQVRDKVEESIITQAKEICQKRSVEMHIDVWRKGEPKPCSESVQNVIREAFEKMDLEPFTLPSGAGHDSGNFYDFCEMGMIFIRSKDGISHNPAEWSSIEDCEDGVNVLYYTLLDLAVPVH
jgi:allantoate deiminase